jgi:penicillin-binding protein 1A
VGYTSQLVAGVWLGNDDGSATKRASGANLPVDIWSRFMREALQGVAPTPLPGGGAMREAAPLAQAAPPIPPADVPAPAPASIPAPVTRPATVAPPPQPPTPMQVQRQEPPRAPRREQAVDQSNDQSNDLLPPASIPRSGSQQRGPLDRLFGG